MRDKVGEVIDRAEGRRRRRSRPSELDEAEAFLRWLADDHFTFLGYQPYELEADAGDGVQLRRVKGTGLGILRG